MILMILVLGIIYLSCFGYGEALMQRLNLDDLVMNGSIGFIILLALLQVGYFPVQFFNLNFILIALWSMIVIIMGLVLTCHYRRALLHSIKSTRFLILCGVSILFFVIFYFVSIDITFSDSPMYLNYIAQNINNPQVNLFNLYSGAVGSEWDTLYLYQGYYHFASFIVWLVNFPHYVFGSMMTMDTLPLVIWGMGWLYQVVSTGFIIDIIDDLDLDHRFNKKILLFFTICFTNFYYWKVVYGFYGNTFRSLIIWVVLFLIYRYINSNENKAYLQLIQISLFAGCATSSSFFFIAFEVMFGFLCYLIYTKHSQWVKIMANMVLPLVIYAAIYLYKGNALLGSGCAIIALLYYLYRDKPFLSKAISSLEQWVLSRSAWMWLLLLMIIFYGGSILIHHMDPNYLYDMAYWAQDHTHYDMVKDYRFVYSGWLDNILNIIRWLGLMCWLFQRRSQGIKAIKVIVVVTMVIFLSPFSTEFVSKMISGNVFYRAIEIIFNPLTESFYILALVNFIRSKWFRRTLATALCMITIYAHIASFIGDDNGLYRFYIDAGQSVDHIYKIMCEEVDIIRRFSGVLNENNERNRTDQVTVISQAEGLRVFEPSIHQLFTARDYFYPSVRVSDTFYQMATNHYDWIDYPDDLPYDQVCNYLHEYSVDYVIVKTDPYYQNYEFDYATDACSIDQASNSMFTIKKVY